MPKKFTAKQWEGITSLLNSNPEKYGLPTRTYGSVVMASFNIRKLGAERKRTGAIWEFLGQVCRQFDLIAVQEVMDDMSGLFRLKDEMGPEFGIIVSDKTGVFPGKAGLGERLAFIFRWTVVRRSEVVSDISFDRSEVISILTENIEEIDKVIHPYAKKLKSYQAGTLKRKPSVPKIPVFFSFIRQPYAVSFQVVGHPDSRPYEFIAVNAHLIYGKYIDNRRQEFDALMRWILARVEEGHKARYPNFILLGDLNLDYDSPTNDRKRFEHLLKSVNADTGEIVNVNFPFLDPHPKHGLFRTNARMNQTFDQIGFFFRDKSLPTYLENSDMGKAAEGPDYGMFNFVHLFHDFLRQEEPGGKFDKAISRMSSAEKREFYGMFEHSVSDHMPIWVRLPMPV